eukprot:5529604-Alexandrium_andersonii.AAC.1
MNTSPPGSDPEAKLLSSSSTSTKYFAGFAAGRWAFKDAIESRMLAKQRAWQRLATVSPTAVARPVQTIAFGTCRPQS